MDKVDINELRIGSWVNTDGVGPIQIMTGQDIDVIKRSGFDYPPIKLTKEWLEKFEFKFEEGWKLEFPDLKLTICVNFFDRGTSCQVGIAAPGTVIPVNVEIKYVHELQNIVQAFTKVELQ